MLWEGLMAKKNTTKGKAPIKTTAAAVSSSVNLPLADRAPKEEFNPDYTYVIRNLKKIGTLAAVFIAILIILSFIL
jgi:hypothetical protein